MNLSVLAPNIISQLDKSTSLAPILTKDMVDNCGRTAMAYKTGGVHESRERFIEEFGTSLFWIGGIPIFRKLFDFAIFKPLKLNPNLDLRVLPNVQKIIKSSTKQIINNPAIIKNQNLYIGLNVAKFLTTTLIPLYVLVKALPKFNQNLTKNLILNENKKHKNNTQNNTNKTTDNPIKLDTKSQVTFASFLKPQKISFTGLGKFLNNQLNPIVLAQKAQVDPVGNMILLDYGISGGRLYNARNHDEKTEVAVREAGIIVFFYYAAEWLKSGLQKLSNKLFKTPIQLDARVLKDKNFINSVKEAVSSNSAKDKLLEFVKGGEEEILSFIDNHLQPENIIKDSKGGMIFKNYTLELARKLGLIKLTPDGKGGFIRDLTQFIDINKVKEQNEFLEKFVKAAESQKNNIEKFTKNAFNVKSLMVLTNIAVCSFTLAYLLPKLQYYIRQKRTNSTEFPGIREYVEEAQKMRLTSPQHTAFLAQTKKQAA